MTQEADLDEVAVVVFVAAAAKAVGAAVATTCLDEGLDGSKGSRGVTPSAR